MVKAFFVEPARRASSAAASAPARAQGGRAAQAACPSRSWTSTRSSWPPSRCPEEIKPEEGIDLGVEGGVPGGVEGGVPGGVVGGVVGGLPDAPPPVQAVRVGGQIKEPKKLKDVAPVYPDIAKQARVQGIVILECTISPQGKVTDVKVLRGIPLLERGGDRRGEAVGLHAHPAERRAGAGHHDGHGELQAVLSRHRIHRKRVQEDAQCSLI